MPPHLHRALLLLACALSFLMGRDALAAPQVAVLDLDGYQVSWQDAQVMTQGLRDGFLDDGRLDPMTGFDVADRISSGHEDQIRRARELLAEGRRQMDMGNLSAALRVFQEGIELHQGARSFIGRRPELADALYFAALALVRSGKRGEAEEYIVEVSRLHPGYHEDRAVNPSREILSLFQDAQATIQRGPKHLPSPSEIAPLSPLLGCEHVVAGHVSADGKLHARLYRDGQVVGEATVQVPEIPLYPGDPIYSDLAGRLLGATSPGEFASIPPVSDSGKEATFAGLPDHSQQRDPQGGAETGSGRGPSSEDGSTWGRRPRSKVKASGSIRYGGPITQRWWFWTGVGAVLVGGGVILYLELREPPPDPKAKETDGYKVTVDPSGLDSR